LEREANIAFGLSFKKLAVAGGLGVFVFVLKYMLPQFLWIVIIILTGGGFLVLTFVKVGGHSVYELIVNSFYYFGIQYVILLRMPTNMNFHLRWNIQILKMC